MVSASFTDQAQTRGYFERPNGMVCQGPLPPNDGEIRAEYEAFIASGGVVKPYVIPAPAPQPVLAQDLMAQFAVADYTAIKIAVAANDTLGLLWASLQAQRDPMIVSNARFQSGWAALVTVLGASRMSAIATALGITIPA